jgi:hypothetical protein
MDMQLMHTLTYWKPGYTVIWYLLVQAIIYPHPALPGPTVL